MRLRISASTRSISTKPNSGRAVVARPVERGGEGPGARHLRAGARDQPVAELGREEFLRHRDARALVQQAQRSGPRQRGKVDGIAQLPPCLARAAPEQPQLVLRRPPAALGARLQAFERRVPVLRQAGAERRHRAAEMGRLGAAALRRLDDRLHAVIGAERRARQQVLAERGQRLGVADGGKQAPRLVLPSFRFEPKRPARIVRCERSTQRTLASLIVPRDHLACGADAGIQRAFEIARPLRRGFSPGPVDAAAGLAQRVPVPRHRAPAPCCRHSRGCEARAASRYPRSRCSPPLRARRSAPARRSPSPCAPPCRRAHRKRVTAFDEAQQHRRLAVLPILQHQPHRVVVGRDLAGEPLSRQKACA